MLRALQIENYALIRSLSIQFDEGFTVITGETGAGKSILMGALSLILGSRAEIDVLYDKNRKCIVEGTFDLTHLSLQSFFEQNDLDYSDLSTIRREINEHGKSRAFVNDTPVNLTILRALASALIDIHSQHQNLLLQDSAFRLDIIDQYAQNQLLRDDYRQKLTAWQQADKAYMQLKQECAEAALQQEFNLFTVNELEQARLHTSEQEELEQNIRRLSHAEEIKTHLYHAGQILSEQEEETVIQKLQSVQNEISQLQHLGGGYEEISRRLNAAVLEIKDLAYDIVMEYNNVEINPSELEHLNERLDLILTLQHKYQVEDTTELITLLDQLKQKISDYSDHVEQLAQLERQVCEHLLQTQQAADQLSQSRSEVLDSFRQCIEQQLQQLGMPDSRFHIHLSRRAEMQWSGIDEVTFTFSANRGIAPADLSKIASGGEMSRIMLALKSVITDTTLLPTVIFDEIDSGISGETANRVATVMGQLSAEHQVIAISHLPQIAARGDHHYLVYKENHEGKAVTNLKLLNPIERIDAIASMLGGTRASDSAHNTAKELLASFHSSAQ